MSSTALILHPTANPHPGSYRLNTSNWPNHGTGASDLYLTDWPLDPAFKDWDQPHWEIYQYHDGRIIVHACRPSESEVRDGDLCGALGSIITVARPTNGVRGSLRAALRIARILCQCGPSDGAILHYADILSVESIETDIPLKYHFAAEAAAFVREPTNCYRRC
jgi:hypothetical protein